MSFTQINPDGLVAIPEDILEEFELKPGDRLEFRKEDHHMVVTPVKKKPFSAFLGRFQVEHALDFKEEREIAWREQTRRLTEENPANRG
jgi:bifunctional DNA-binding transcriptional regulator/antitoxin component of YhaV-PrlF toxin-antitoxin module